MATMRIQTPEGDLDFEPLEGEHFDVAPLGFECLARVLVGADRALPLRYSNAKVVAPTESPLLGKSVSFNTDFTFHGQVSLFGLAPGGWLPPLVANRRVAILDRNVVSDLDHMAPLEPSAVVAPSERAWLLRQFARSAFEVSPAAHLMEGKWMRSPSLEDMAAEMTKVAAILSEKLPNARVHELKAAELAALHALLTEQQDLAAKRQSFLLEVVPAVREPANYLRRGSLEALIFAAAERGGLRRVDFAVLAALSCVYEDSSLPRARVYRPGRALLKPRADYGAENAYNAVADIAALQLLVNAHAFLHDYQAILFTGDVGMAAFWTALEVTGIEATTAGGGKGSATVEVTISKGLAPGLDLDGRLALRTRLLGE